MYQFFIKTDNIIDDGILLNYPDDVNHIRNVLRMKPGEKIRCCCPEREKDYICILESIQKEEVRGVICDVIGSSRELPVKITLFQGLAKGDKMETIIQKAVELGAYEIVPIAVNRCVVHLDPSRAKKKVARWNTIAQSAAKQSKRQYVPAVTDVMDFQEALKYAGEKDMLLIPYEEAKGISYTRECFEKVKGAKSVGIFIGPEGGFEKKEVDQARKAGAKEITLGHRILRTETAGITVLSILMYLLEEDDECEEQNEQEG